MKTTKIRRGDSVRPELIGPFGLVCLFEGFPYQVCYNQKGVRHGHDHKRGPEEVGSLMGTDRVRDKRHHSSMAKNYVTPTLWKVRLRLFGL